MNVQIADLLYLYDRQTDHNIVAVRCQPGLLLVLHEDTVATYEARLWEEGRYREEQAPWPHSEMAAKVLGWGHQTKERIDLGFEVQIDRLATGGPLRIAADLEKFYVLMGLWSLCMKAPHLVQLAIGDRLPEVTGYINKRIADGEGRMLTGAEAENMLFDLCYRLFDQMEKGT